MAAETMLPEEMLPCLPVDYSELGADQLG